MGIKHLNKILRSSNAIQRIETLEEVSQGEPTLIAVDASLYCYKFACSPAGNPIRLLTQQIVRLYRAKLFPVYIFDGRAPQEKEEVLIKRHRRQKSNLPHHFMIEMRAVLLELGVPVIVPEGEGDAACGALYRMGLVKACLTDDLDILVHGCGTIIRQDRERIYLYKIERILEEFGMSMEEFVRICIVMGCDYNRGVDFTKAKFFMHHPHEAQLELSWSETCDAALALYQGTIPRMKLLWTPETERRSSTVNTDIMGEDMSYSTIVRILSLSNSEIYFPLQQIERV